MTNKQLIKELTKLPPNAIVCVGIRYTYSDEANHVWIDNDGTIVITTKD